MPVRARISLWYCDFCHHGPHNGERDTRCSACNRQMNGSAFQVLRESNEQARSAPSPVTQNNRESPQELLSTRPVVSVTALSPWIGGSGTTREGQIRQELLTLGERIDSTISEGPNTSLTSEANAVSPIPRPNDLNPSNLSSHQTETSQHEREGRDASLLAYLHNTNDPWPANLVGSPRVPVPGVMAPFSAVTGRPAAVPTRRRFNPEELAQVNAARLRGACAECKRRHRKCRHLSENVVLNPRDVQNQIAVQDQVHVEDDIDVHDQIDVQDQISRTANQSSRSPAAEQQDLHGHTSHPLLQRQASGVVESSETSGILSVEAPRRGRTLSQMLDRFDSGTGHRRLYSISATLYSEIQQSTAYKDDFYPYEESQVISQEDQSLDELTHNDTVGDDESELPTDSLHETDQANTKSPVLVDADLSGDRIFLEPVNSISALEEDDFTGLDIASGLKEIDAFYDDGNQSRNQTRSRTSRCRLETLDDRRLC